MIEKFVAEFKKFSEHEAVSSLSEEAQVSLFGIYCQTATQIREQKSGSKPARTNTRRGRGGNGEASGKQIGFIKALIKTGDLDDLDTQNLTVASASKLIDKGLKTRKRRERQEAEAERQEAEMAEVVEAEEEGEFTGSFNHQSDGYASSESLFG